MSLLIEWIDDLPLALRRMRGSFACGSRMTAKNKQRQQQIPCGNNSQKGKSKGAAPSLLLSLALSMLMFVMTGCGYHVAGSATHIPANVRTLAVPIFASKVQGFGTETAFTQAVVRELNTRTRYRVLTGRDGIGADATLRGTIVAETVAPLTYDSSSGQTSSYLMSVTASVQLVAHDGTVLYSNDAFAWREQYQSTQDLSGFVQEDGAAMRRAGQAFAQALVSDMLESFQ